MEEILITEFPAEYEEPEFSEVCNIIDATFGGSGWGGDSWSTSNC